jgi:pyruvate formate-lyase activating enzyme-like uncharacterized protein
MITKSLDIQETRERTGWAYSQMKWLTDEEAKAANRKRNELLQSISGSINSHFQGNKICTGHLSPGCITCGQGTWSCLFIGSLCTANCFYCPQDRKATQDQPPTESGLMFDDPDDYVHYLDEFKFRGVGFSGGEPLLQFEKILVYLRKIRERLGKRIYLWLYTNGDLVDKKKLILLKEAGLNEIRFDIAARKYNLNALKLATKIIDKVTVEIPAIPEDYEILKRRLCQMQAMGVAHLNLHQLFASPHCYQQFIDRRYTFLHQPEIAILESEMTALRLIKYARNHNIGLAINYCSAIYKHRLQKSGYRKRFQSLIKEAYEGLTESGFIRRLVIHNTPVNIKKLVKFFEENKCQAGLWFLNKKGREIFFHHSLLQYIDFSQHDLILTYFAPQITATRDEELKSIKEIALNPGRNLFVGSRLVYQAIIKNPVAIKSFQELFIESRKDVDVFKKFFRDYNLATKADVAEMMNERDRLYYLKTWERIGSGPYEIY